MISIKMLKETEPQIIREIAELHIKAFPSFFLTQLGKGFLYTLYRGYLEDPSSGILIAEGDEGIVGFTAYSEDYPLFYKGLIKRHLLKFALCSVGAVVKHPAFIKRLFGAFKKSESVVKEEAYVELASICVDPYVEGKGIGTKLIDSLKEIVDFERFSYINLETDADNNEGANAFYVKNGFKLERVFYTKEGRKMNEYRFAPGVKA